MSLSPRITTTTTTEVTNKIHQEQIKKLSQIVKLACKYGKEQEKFRQQDLVLYKTMFKTDPGRAMQIAQKWINPYRHVFTKRR